MNKLRINDKILDILTHYDINKDEAVTYLIALYYNYKPDYIPELLKATVARLGILNLEEKTNKISWVVPLFTDAPYEEWTKSPVTTEFIDKYRKMFTAKNVEKRSTVKEIMPRMLKLFKENKVTTNEVYGATKLYLGSTGSTYIMLPHYFIQKGSGSSITFTILAWIERYRELEQLSNGESITRTMK